MSTLLTVLERSTIGLLLCGSVIQQGVRVYLARL